MTSGVVFEINNETRVIVSDECTFSNFSKYILSRFTSINVPMIGTACLKTDNNLVFKFCKDAESSYQEQAPGKSDKYLSWRATIASTVGGSDKVELVYKTGSNDVNISCFVISCTEKYPRGLRGNCHELCNYAPLPTEENIVERQKLVNWYLQALDRIIKAENVRLDVGRIVRGRHPNQDFSVAAVKVNEHGTEVVLNSSVYCHTSGFNQALSSVLEYMENFTQHKRFPLDGYSIMHYDIFTAFWALWNYVSSRTRYNQVQISYGKSTGIIIRVLHTKKKKVVYDSAIHPFFGNRYDDLYSALQHATTYIARF